MDKVILNHIKDYDLYLNDQAWGNDPFDLCAYTGQPYICTNVSTGSSVLVRQGVVTSTG